MPTVVYEPPVLQRIQTPDERRQSVNWGLLTFLLLNVALWGGSVLLYSAFLSKN